MEILALSSVMKRVILSLIALCAVATASAQLKTSYFMKGSYFRTDLNPALAPTRGYVALPAIGGLGIDFSNNAFSMRNLIYKHEGEIVTALHSSVSADQFLSTLPKKISIANSEQVNILGVGFYNRRGTYWNFGINMRSYLAFTTNRDLFAAMKSLGNRSIDMRSTALDMNIYAEAYIGAAFALNDWLDFGVRAKGLWGLFNANAFATEADVTTSRTEILGTLSAQVRGAGMIINSQDAIGALEELILEKPDLSQTNNGGFAVDLGVNASLLDRRLNLSAAVTDVGFIRWAKGATLDVRGNFYYRGVDLDSEQVDAGASSDVQSQESRSYSRFLNANLNLGAEYAILDEQISFGLMWHNQLRPNYIWSELTASVNFRAGRWFDVSFSHTFLGRNRPGVFGTAINIHPNGFNLFVGADFIDTTFYRSSEILVPKNLKSLSLYIGLGFNFGKYREYIGDM